MVQTRAQKMATVAKPKSRSRSRSATKQKSPTKHKSAPKSRNASLRKYLKKKTPKERRKVRKYSSPFCANAGKALRSCQLGKRYSNWTLGKMNLVRKQKKQ